MKRSLLSTFAALSAFAALCFGAAPARADVCGDLFDECELADGVVAWNVSELAAYFPLDIATCQKITDGVLAQCQAAVKAAAKCWQGQFDSVPKTAKPACKTEGTGASECNASFKSVYADESEELDVFVGIELDCCEDRAADFFEVCTEGF
jgi:hypothetical protein